MLVISKILHAKLRALFNGANPPSTEAINGLRAWADVCTWLCVLLAIACFLAGLTAIGEADNIDPLQAIIGASLIVIVGVWSVFQGFDSAFFPLRLDIVPINEPGTQTELGQLAAQNDTVATRLTAIAAQRRGVTFYELALFRQWRQQTSKQVA